MRIFPFISLTLSVVSLVVSLYAFVINFKSNSYSELEDKDDEFEGDEEED